MVLSGSPLDFLEAFLGGVLLSFTPCVYPLIPITAGYIGVNAGVTHRKGFALSLVYVTGIATTYSTLGLVASLTGTLFGRVNSHPITYIVVGIIIIVFGLSMLDLFVITLPQMVRLPTLKKQSYFSTFLLGLSSGFVASPCLTPVLGSILFYLAAKKNVVYGVSLLFCFAYGMGLVLILIGVFSAALLRLPKSGKWMSYVQKISAVVLIAMGGYFIYHGIRRI
jgi:thiol:disulfide interchange protein DsbD